MGVVCIYVTTKDSRGPVRWSFESRSERPRSHRRLIGAIVCSAVLLAASCGEGVQKVVTLVFSNDQPDEVTISTSTELGTAERGTPEAAAIEREREALLAGSDDWSARFANADPEFERVTFQREKKQLQRVEHTARVRFANLQRFFFDTNLLVEVTSGDGGNELTIHAGASTRATRAQKDHVNQLLDNFSEQAVRYFAATRALYAYLDSNADRAGPLFLALGNAMLGDKKDFEEPEQPGPELRDAEKHLVSAITDAIEAMVDGDNGRAGDVDREFDAAFNPFPAEFHVVVPGEPLAVEGFDLSKEGGLVVKSVGVLDGLARLEGKWVSPDPVARLLRSENAPQAPRLFADDMMKAPRRAVDVVRPGEVRQALIDAMRPAEFYRVRWAKKKAAR